MKYIIGWPEISNIYLGGLKYEIVSFLGWPKIQNCDIVSFWSVWYMGGLWPEFCKCDKKKDEKKVQSGHTSEI